MPMLNDSSDCVSDANKLAERKKEEKEKFDARHQCELKPLVIGSTVSSVGFMGGPVITGVMFILGGLRVPSRVLAVWRPGTIMASGMVTSPPPFTQIWT